MTWDRRQMIADPRPVLPIEAFVENAPAPEPKDPCEHLNVYRDPQDKTQVWCSDCGKRVK